MAATGVLSQLGTPIVIGASCAVGVLLLLLVVLLYKYKQVHTPGYTWVFQKVGYVTCPGKLTPQLKPNVVATLPVGCCNIVNQQVG